MDFTFSEHILFLFGLMMVCYIPYFMDRYGYRKEEEFSPWVPAMAGFSLFITLEAIYWALELVTL